MKSFWKREIETHEIISFDMFDTLVKRDLASPQDVFEIAARLYRAEMNINVDDFKNIRIQSLKRAKEKNGHEVNLKEIYAEMDDFDGITKENLMKCELKVELALCVPNLQMKRIFEWCKRENKIIYIISDMYLQSEFLEKILRKCGYTGYKKIFASCEKNKIKRTGALYNEFLYQEHLNANQVLHIGNSKKADILGAAKAGIISLYIPTCENHMMYSSLESNSTDGGFLKNFCNNRIVGIKSRSVKLGYEVLGGLITSFNNWLHDNVSGYDQILFLSRDTKLFYEAYLMMYPEDAGRVKYLRVSRKALMPAILLNYKNYEEILKQLWESGKELSEILKLFGINSKDHLKEIYEAGISETEFINVKDSRNLKPVLEIMDKLSSEIILNNEKNAKVVMQFLNANISGDSVAVVDLGWHSTTQWFLSLLMKDVEFNGFYIGTEGLRDGKKINDSGFLFNKKGDTNMYSGTFLLETLCLELCGSVLMYEKRDAEAVPVLGTCEQNDVDYIKSIHRGCRLFVKNFVECPLWKLFRTSPSTAFEAYMSLLNSPDKIEIERFKNVTYEDFKLYCLIPNRNRWVYILNPGIFAEDFLNSRWKAGFLKCFFGLDLKWHDSYYRFLRFIGEKA